MSRIAAAADPAYRRSDALNAALYAAAYFVGAEVGYALSLGPSVGGTFWPPAGISLAVFLAARARAWPRLLAAGLLANYVSDMLHGQTMPASIGFAFANLSEPVIGAYLLRRFFPRPMTFTRLPEVVALALVVTFVSAPISSAVGALAAELWTERPPGFPASWRTWWIGDAVGALVLTPCVLRIMRGWRRLPTVPLRTWLEAAGFGVVLLVVTEVVFSAPPTSLSVPFLVYPVLLWGSVRFGPIGVGAALCLIVVLTARQTATGFGPFAAEHLSLGDRLIALQIYIGVMAVSFHALGVLWEERSRAARALRRAHTGLEARYRRIVERQRDANRSLREREEALSTVLEQMAEAQRQREQLLEAERFARGEAERASRLKDEFLATLSHELRTPLNAIIGWAHILRRAPDAATRSQAVETIERNARAQARIIEDLLDMSRIMAGKVGLSLANVKLAEIVAAAADALRPAADAKGIELSIDVGSASELSISGDAARLQQVVTNLLDNGIKFTPPGGRVEAALVSGAREVRLVVRDTGQGIPAEFMPAVFERFRQADASTTRRHLGLGLGLSIAKQIVEMHGGSITAHSDGPDSGATFTVTLPLTHEGRGAGTADRTDTAAAPVDLTGLRVLVVDDEADARELLHRMLLDQGCEVTAASSATDALRRAAGHRYDMLLTDIGMPGMDGYELLRRARGAGAELKAVAVTAFARPEDRERAFASGFDGHLAKPLDPARLMQVLGEILSSAREDRRSDASSDAEGETRSSGAARP